MFKSKTYDEYLKWWNYWNSKIPQDGPLIERMTSTSVAAKLESKTYRQRVLGHMIEIPNVQQQQQEPELLSLGVQFRGGFTNSSPTGNW